MNNIIEPTALPTRSHEANGRVLQLVREGYRLLAEIHDELGRSGGDSEESQQHVTNATRELAAIQEAYDRRGRER